MNLGRPEVIRHVIAEPVTWRQVAADVPEFLEVVRLVALGRLDSEWRVAAGAASARNEVFAFHLFGEGEEGLRFHLGAMDKLVRYAVVRDNREAIFFEASPQLLSECIGIAVGVLQGNGGDIVSSDRSHVFVLAEDCGQGSISDASAALIRLARLPASRARRPSLAITGRWLGARPPVTAICIAIELKFAKPHSANVTISRLRWLNTAASILPRSMKATNSLRTSFVPNRPPAVPASFHGTPIRNMTGWKT